MGKRRDLKMSGAAMYKQWAQQAEREGRSHHSAGEPAGASNNTRLANSTTSPSTAKNQVNRTGNRAGWQPAPNEYDVRTRCATEEKDRTSLCFQAKKQNV